MGTPPRLLLLYGDDGFTITQQVDVLRKELGPKTESEMNTQRFPGPGLSAAQLRAAVTVIPFLAPRRLVIVEQAGKMIPNQAAQPAFREVFESIPATTTLVLLEPLVLDRRDSEERYLKASFLSRWVSEHSDVAAARRCVLPKGREFAGWVTKRAAELGGKIQSPAALLLGELVAGDPHAAEMELRKLLDYVDGRRPIETADVEELSAFHGEGKVFAMVDAIGQRNARLATQLLHRLLEDDDPEYAFVMIVRQFRLLLLAREAIDRGHSPREVLPGQPPFVVDKITAQARNFRMLDLEQAYHRLAATDLARKSSQQDLATALYTLIVSVAA
jgi:DNA polymerase III subunit delta